MTEQLRGTQLPAGIKPQQQLMLESEPWLKDQAWGHKSCNDNAFCIPIQAKREKCSNINTDILVTVVRKWTAEHP